MREHRRDPLPLHTNDARIVAVGTGLWVVLLIGLLVWRDAVDRAGLIWWFGMAACGIALGLFGLVYLRVRPAQLARKQQEREERERLRSAGP